VEHEQLMAILANGGLPTLLAVGLVWFLRRVVAAVDAVGPTLQKALGEVSQSHTRAIEKLMASQDAREAAANERIDRLIDQLVGSSKGEEEAA